MCVRACACARQNVVAQYLGALRVGQVYSNPLGFDDDDYETVAFFNRNLRLAHLYSCYGDPDGNLMACHLPNGVGGRAVRNAEQQAPVRMNVGGAAGGGSDGCGGIGGRAEVPTRLRIDLLQEKAIQTVPREFYLPRHTTTDAFGVSHRAPRRCCGCRHLRSCSCRQFTKEYLYPAEPVKADQDAVDSDAEDGYNTSNASRRSSQSTVPMIEKSQGENKSA